MKTLRCLVIINEHSGGGRRQPRLAALLSCPPAGLALETAVTRGPGDATRIAREAAPRFDIVAAAGGDGTAGEAATGILESQAPETRLAMLPIGTGNDAARAIGIPDLAAGIAALTSGASRAVDALETTYQRGGEALRRVCLVGAGAGFPGEVVARTTPRVKRTLGRWSYAWAAFAAAAAYRYPAIRATVDGTALEGTFIIAAAANIETTGGGQLRMAPGAKCDDGLMRVLLIRHTPKARLLTQLPRLATGSHIGLPEVVYLSAREARFESEPPVGLNVDGEREGETPVSLRLLPRALRVLTPTEAGPHPADAARRGFTPAG